MRAAVVLKTAEPHCIANMEGHELVLGITQSMREGSIKERSGLLGFRIAIWEVIPYMTTR
jgi:hypothetical protein